MMNTIKEMRRRTTSWLTLMALTVLLGSGCSTQKMAIRKGQSSVSYQDQPVALMVVKGANTYKPTFVPSLVFIEVEALDGKQKKTKFKVDHPVVEVEDEYSLQLISLQLPAGRYRLIEGREFANNFWVSGRYDLPLGMEFELPPGTIQYYGRIEYNNRERLNDSEVRSGPIFPLID